MCSRIHGRTDEVVKKVVKKTVKDHLVRLDRDVKRLRKDLSKMNGIGENYIRIRRKVLISICKIRDKGFETIIDELKQHKTVKSHRVRCYST